MKRPIRISITTGDEDGIGFEVVARSLYKLGPQSGTSFVLWRSPRAPKRYLRRIDSKFRRRTVSTWPEALGAFSSDKKVIVDIASSLAPPLWVSQSAEAAGFGHIDGLATAPISKTIIRECGLADIGHTDILARVSKSGPLYMGFSGEFFSVMLATGHSPIAKLPSVLTKERLEGALRQAHAFKAWLPRNRSSKPIALLGLNPHAGENGIIGGEEEVLHVPLVAKLRAEGIKVEGPHPGDTVFKKENWSKYSVFVANYHDQGLIPFKMIHGHSGVHVTLGLPFVRTSVDHGTAKDLFGKDRADYSSMLDSIRWAIAMARGNA